MVKISEASEEVVELITEQKPAIMSYYNDVNFNLQVTQFTPESFSTQVVAGLNYDVVYKINPSQKIEVKFYQDLDENVTITSASEPYEIEVDTNKQTGQLLLKKFEDNAKSTMDVLLKEVRELPDDEDVKEKYYQARAIYNEIAEQTGVESPSKKAEAKAVKVAVDNKKKADIITKVKEVVTVADFTDQLEIIEVEPEVLYNFTLVQNEVEIVNAISDAKNDPDVAAALAKGLVEAKTEKEMAVAIVEAEALGKLKNVTEDHDIQQIVESKALKVTKI